MRKRHQNISALFSTVFGSNFKSGGNVPAGDHFEKIDVNSFPVLTLHKERNSNSLRRAHTHTLARARVRTHTNRCLGKYRI